MKYIFILVFLFSTSMMAQDKLGVELGVSFSNFNGDNLPEDRTALTSLVPGVYFEKGISDLFSLKFLGSYERRGYNFQFGSVIIIDPNDPVFTEEQDLQVISEFVSLAALAKIQGGKVIEVFINLGPYFGIITEKSLAGKNDFGLLGGIGLQKELGPVQLFIEGRASFGITNTFDAGQIGGATIRTSAFYALAGVGFDI